MYSVLGIAETEKETPEHLDLAGVSSRPKNSQGSSAFQMSPPSPDSKKKIPGYYETLRKVSNRALSYMWLKCRDDWQTG